MSIFSFFPNEIYAVENINSDSIEISLLTCYPGNEIYSLYGHTAIRYTDNKNNIDMAINYGMFSFKKPFFIPRFILGLTDYEIGITPFNYFYDEYTRNGRDIIQQVLNLTHQEKMSIISAIENNYLPENRTYRYNYFYDNCTTRARDILISNINGEVIYTDKKKTYPSFRTMIHSFNADYPWGRWGKDMLLGFMADQETTQKERQFLPFNLMTDFDNAVIKSKDGKTRPLIKQRCYIIKNNIPNKEQTTLFTPTFCSWIFFCITVFLTISEYLFKKDFCFFDISLMFFDGCLGLILFIMLFSEHPATSTNLQILLLNPVPLFFICRVYKNVRNSRKDAFWIHATGIIILFIVAGIFQNYAEGMYVLALTLLLRCSRRIIFQKRNYD